MDRAIGAGPWAGPKEPAHGPGHRSRPMGRAIGAGPWAGPWSDPKAMAGHGWPFLKKLITLPVG